MASPLFSAFGPEPIATRIGIGEGKFLVTTPSLYQKKMAALRERLPSLEHVILVGEGEADDPEHQRWSDLIGSASPHYTIGPADREDPALLHFTSGTTGRTKGALHVHDTVVAHHMTGYYALDLHPVDIFCAPPTPAGSRGRAMAYWRR